MKNFPVLSLNPNITDAISKIVSIGIADGIKEGLDCRIHLVDEEGGPISTIAEITELPTFLNPEHKRKVSVSAAYMQVLWIICDIALKNNDTIAVEVEVDKMSPEEKEQYYKELEVDAPETRYLKTLLDKKKIFQESAEKVDLIELICSKKLTEAEMDTVYTLDMTSGSGVLTNSMYTYAMTFCLLHEFSHHSLGQDFSKEATLNDEIEADQSAFWSMYSDLEGKLKLSAMYGIICSLVSLLFINPKLLDDGIHPKPVERIFEYYELIKDESPKYAGLLCHLLYIWAVYTRDDEMPKWDRPYNDLIYLMKDHLQEIEERNNR